MSSPGWRWLASTRARGGVVLREIRLRLAEADYRPEDAGVAASLIRRVDALI